MFIYYCYGFTRILLYFPVFFFFDKLFLTVNVGLRKKTNVTGRFSGTSSVRTQSPQPKHYFRDTHAGETSTNEYYQVHKTNECMIVRGRIINDITMRRMWVYPPGNSAHGSNRVCDDGIKDGGGTVVGTVTIPRRNIPRL